MYTSRTGLTIGFHGTDENIVKSVLNGKSELEASNNSYDWLGNGIYFWDNSPSRALVWAKNLRKKRNSKIKKAAVIGAIIDLGYCLDLLDYNNLQLVKKSYSILTTLLSKTKPDHKIPTNKGKAEDLLQRELDCAVLETLHESMGVNGEREFESVRGVFWEGRELYPKAGFREKDHIQICIREINCIKGYFLPLKRIADI